MATLQELENIAAEANAAYEEYQKHPILWKEEMTKEENAAYRKYRRGLNKVQDAAIAAEGDVFHFKQEQEFNELLTRATNVRIQRIADMIHEETCHWNHMDKCGYHYSTWENPNMDRLRYYPIAENYIAQNGGLEAVEAKMEILNQANKIRATLT